MEKYEQHILDLSSSCSLLIFHVQPLFLAGGFRWTILQRSLRWGHLILLSLLQITVTGILEDIFVGLISSH